MTQTIRLATRGSDLALRQAQTVAGALESRRRTIELVEVETTGDSVRDELIHRLGKTGAFVRSLDEKVLDGTVDAAVHSMKDVPTEFPSDLVVAGIPERGPPGDVLVTPGGASLADLPDGATVGTASLRRTAQLLARRSDLDVRPLRGNVDTRVEKLLAPTLQAEHERRLDAEAGDQSSEQPEGGGDSEVETDSDRATARHSRNDDGDGTSEASDDRTVDEWFDDRSELERQALGRDPEETYDAIVLAEAGLERIGLLEGIAYDRFPQTFVPAPGQGALAVTAREDSDVGESIRREIDHPRTRVEVTVERTILETLGGGCVAPVGIYAVLQGEDVQARVRVLSQDGREEIEESRGLPVERHPEAAREFAEALADRGAADLVQRARRESE